MGDRAAQGRTYGNLGNTYYLLGDFEKAVFAHEKVSGYLCCWYHTRMMYVYKYGNEQHLYIFSLFINRRM